MRSTVSTAELEERVKALVRPERWAHIQRVAALAREIALKNGLDGERAYLAGLLHDAARDLSEEELLKLAPPENEVERAHPLSLHGRAARVLAEGPFGLGWLRPQALFGIAGIDPLLHAIFWSLTLNTFAFLAGSLVSFPSPVERMQGLAFVNAFERDA
ncbi:MAG: HD domain-containing protein, partial [Thermus sp.]